jgi:dTDP-L-rhamnose 4-epimerase
MSRGDWNNYCPTCQKPIEPIQTDEGAVQQCNSIYAISKMNQEQMVANIGQTYSIPYTNFRYFNVYGPRQSLSNPYTGVAAIFMSRIKNDNPPVVYEDGNQTRDFISVHDVARANLLALEKSESDFKTINIGTGVPVTIRGMAEKIADLCGKGYIRPNIQNKFRKGDVRHCYADIALAKRYLGFEPSVSFETGMRELIGWSRGVEAEDKFEQAEQELKAKGLV